MNGEASTGRRGRVLMVLDQPFPPDARVEREAAALVADGWDVTLLCLASDGKPTRETLRGIHIWRVTPSEEVPRWFGRGLVKTLLGNVWTVDSAWFWLIAQAIDTVEPDVVHVHDLRLLPTVGLIRRSWSVKRPFKLVADLHEHYPALMGLIKGPAAERRWAAVERHSVPQADAVLTVTEEATDRLQGLNPVIETIPNTVEIEKFMTAAEHPEKKPAMPEGRLVVYTGHVNGPHRGLHTVIEAMAHLQARYDDVKLVLAGATRPAYLSRLKEAAQRLGVTNRVIFTGWLDETQFVPWIQASTLCICPHEANRHTQHTFPNKLYLYHLFGKPIITSNCKPLARYADDTQGALVFKSADAPDLARQLETLLDDVPLQTRLGDNGREAVLSRYNWTYTAQVLTGLYRRLQTA